MADPGAQSSLGPHPPGCARGPTPIRCFRFMAGDRRTRRPRWLTAAVGQPHAV